MTPPDWFLQLLGGAAIATLCLLLGALCRPRRAPRKVRLTPEQRARHKQQLQCREEHARDVTRPGLIHAAFDRDSVSRGDDEIWHWHLMMFEHDDPITTALHTHILPGLPAIQGGRATWLIQLHEQLTEPVTRPGGSIEHEGRVRVTDIAVVAQEWDAPRLLCPDFPISRVADGLLYAHFHVQQDPEVLYQTCRKRANPREEPTRRTYSYDLSKVDPVRRTMVHRSRTLPGSTEGLSDR